MDEQIVVREKDPETGMGVIPAHDVVLGKPPVALAGDLFPRVVGVGEAGLGVGVVLGLERLGDPDERLAGRRVDAFLAQQDSPQLDRRIASEACRSIASAARRSRKIGRSAGPGPRRPGRRTCRSRSGRCRRSGSRTLISPKVISSPLNGLTPSPSCRLPGPRPGGKSPIRFPRRPARYRKAECRREKAARRPAANLGRCRSRTRAAPARGSSGTRPRPT